VCVSQPRLTSPAGVRSHAVVCSSTVVLGRPRDAHARRLGRATRPAQNAGVQATLLPPVDVAIIGAGMVGASIAHFASFHLRVLLLEREPHPGMQSTGRSAALFAPSYGPPQVRALTRASRAFYTEPPAGLTTVPLLRPRGALFVGTAEQQCAAEALVAGLTAEGLQARALTTAQALARVPVLNASHAAFAVADEDSLDIEVDALLQGCLRSARARGAALLTGVDIIALEPTSSGWRIRLSDGRCCVARTVVNAAGAWADDVALLAGAQPAGLVPKRRSAFLFEAPAGQAIADWPAVIALDESWYFKPDAGLLLGSPANADPVAPHDVQPEALDIALGIHRIEAATTLRIRRPRSTWAGLRSFVADGEPVLGFDDALPHFFWAAALGGYGIQTAPAVGAWCAALLAGGLPPAGLIEQGIQPDALSINRLRRAPHPVP
jgi:D-arginine dehydrogenase